VSHIELRDKLIDRAVYLVLHGRGLEYGIELDYSWASPCFGTLAILNDAEFIARRVEERTARPVLLVCSPHLYTLVAWPDVDNPAPAGYKLI
jgi:hypothetical protein